MKRRARRAVFGAAALGAALVGVLVLSDWGAVRDHVEAWHFQMTRNTETLEPGPLMNQMIRSDRSFVFDPREGFWSTVLFDPSSRESRPENLHAPYTADEVLHFFREGGYRVLEQRFPRRAYVVILSARPLPGAGGGW